MSHWPYIAGAFVSGLVGGLVSVFWSPNKWLTHNIQHFTAGVVLAAVALEVVPDAARAGAPPRLVLGGFALGGLVMIAMKWAILSIEERQQKSHRKPWGLTVAAAVDTALDGVIIGAGFAMGRGLGALLSFALGLELFCLTLSVGATFRKEKTTRLVTLAVTSGISLLLLLGAGGGVVMFAGASKTVLAVMLSFGSSALLYLVTEELLVETKLPRETLMSTLMFFLGFLTIFAVVLLG